MGRTFPHRFDRSALGAGFYPAVASSPFGDDILLSFTRALVAAEQLGRDDVTDYLSVALSSLDFIGHRYGPDSLEMEDELVRVDRVIADLLALADEAAGKRHTLVVLSADHGVSEPVEELRAEGRDAGVVVLSGIEVSPPVRRLARRFGSDFIRNQWPPYVYLNDESLRAHHLDPEVGALALAREIEKSPGVAAAFTRGEIEHGHLSRSEAGDAVRRSFFAERSGDIHVVVKPGWQIAFEGSRAKYATGHGTPWNYDTFVPLVFAGPGVPHVEVTRRVETVDVAPTIAALAGVAAPARATGHVLPEAVSRAD